MIKSLKIIVYIIYTIHFGCFYKIRLILLHIYIKYSIIPIIIIITLVVKFNNIDTYTYLMLLILDFFFINT